MASANRSYGHDHHHTHGEHGHSHGLVDRSIERSREGVRAVATGLASPALIADGKHARVDGFVSLGVVASALVVALGLEIGDPIIGLVTTLVIFKITWDSWRTVSTTEPGELHEH